VREIKTLSNGRLSYLDEARDARQPPENGEPLREILPQTYIIVERLCTTSGREQNCCQAKARAIDWENVPWSI
jgi:hypothetical protein